MAAHIKNPAFQYWWSVHGLYAVNSVIDKTSGNNKEQGKEMALAVFNGTCNRCEW